MGVNHTRTINTLLESHRAVFSKAAASMVAIHVSITSPLIVFNGHWLVPGSKLALAGRERPPSPPRTLLSGPEQQPGTRTLFEGFWRYHLDGHCWFWVAPPAGRSSFTGFRRISRWTRRRAKPNGGHDRGRGRKAAATWPRRRHACRGGHQAYAERIFASALVRA